MSEDYILYGMQPSYYTAKVRGYLAYKRIPYHETYSFEAALNVIAARTKKFMLPTVVTPDDITLQDSTDIIDFLEQNHPSRPAYPNDPTLMMLCRLFEVFADECLVFPGLHYRWGFPDTHEWALREFAVNGGRGMKLDDARKITDGFAGKINSYLPMLGLDQEEIQSATVESFTQLIRVLEEHFSKEFFLLGDAPCLADFALLGPFWGHLYRDPSPALTQMKAEAPNLCIWIENLHSGFGIKQSSNWKVTDTFIAVLEELGHTYADLINDTHKDLVNFLAQKESGSKAPTAGNTVETRLRGEPLKRQSSVYNGWKIDRWINAYRAIPLADRELADQLLDKANLIATAQAEGSCGLVKKEFDLYIA